MTAPRRFQVTLHAIRPLLCQARGVQHVQGGYMVHFLLQSLLLAYLCGNKNEKATTPPPTVFLTPDRRKVYLVLPQQKMLLFCIQLT